MLLSIPCREKMLQNIVHICVLERGWDKRLRPVIKNSDCLEHPDKMLFALIKNVFQQQCNIVSYSVVISFIRSEFFQSVVKHVGFLGKFYKNVQCFRVLLFI